MFTVMVVRYYISVFLKVTIVGRQALFQKCQFQIFSALNCDVGFRSLVWLNEAFVLFCWLKHIQPFSCSERWDLWMERVH